MISAVACPSPVILGRLCLLKNEDIDRWRFERQLAARGVSGIVGVDEAGRGPLAGPVVAAAVILPSHWVSKGMPEDLVAINDSKQLSETVRATLAGRLLTTEGVRSAVAVVDSLTIDRINILQATFQAMNEAIAALGTGLGHVLVDGNQRSSARWTQTPVIKGDSLSYSIAAASILAKTSRDRLMEEYEEVYPGYGFKDHKGYGTPAHLAALAKLGPCPIHRRSFAPMRIAQPDLFSL